MGAEILMRALRYRCGVVARVEERLGRLVFVQSRIGSMFRIGCERDSDIVGAKGVDILNCIVSIDSNMAGIDFSPNACNKL